MSKRREVEWYKIEQIMLKSFTGGALSETEQALARAAHKADPKEYRELHTRIVRDEIARRRKDGF